MSYIVIPINFSSINYGDTKSAGALLLLARYIPPGFWALYFIFRRLALDSNKYWQTRGLI